MKGIPLKLVRQRVRVFKASPSGKMTAGSALTGAICPPLSWGQPGSDWPGVVENCSTVAVC